MDKIDPDYLQRTVLEKGKTRCVNRCAPPSGGTVTLFGNFIKSEVSWHQLNSKPNDLVLLLMTI